jgi:hypothetical protein
MMASRNSELLDSFIAYCAEHPNERFWQALRNWSGWGCVLVSREWNTVWRSQMDGVAQDTFYWEENHNP